MSEICCAKTGNKCVKTKNCTKKKTKKRVYKTPCTKTLTYGRNPKVTTTCNATVGGNLKVEKDLTVKQDLTVNQDMTVSNLVVNKVLTSVENLIVNNIQRQTGLIRTSQGNVTLDNLSRSRYFLVFDSNTTITVTLSSSFLSNIDIEFVVLGRGGAGDVRIVRDPPTLFFGTIANQGGTVARIEPFGGNILVIRAVAVSDGDRISVSLVGNIMTANGISINGNTYVLSS